jgi:hypothetical protein
MQKADCLINFQTGASTTREAVNMWGWGIGETGRLYLLDAADS